MNKNLSTVLRWARAYLPVLLLLHMLPGCAGTMPTSGYKGNKIKPGYQIEIELGEHTGFYRTNDLSVSYHYIKGADSLKISGVVSFADGIQFNFNVVDYFNLGLLLADSENTILSSRNLVSASWVNLTLDNQVHFSDSVRLPAHATRMAFTYTGQASEGGFRGWRRGGDGGDIQFWQHPVVR